jgi:poly-gamma-glutamate capsule biosynthesis protein CapA/YwtB (metallophosphatase superfamily)
MLFLCGDVMTGRGIDQILPRPGKPTLFESCVRSATTYVELAERATGPVSRPVGFDYLWGDALAELERARPDARIVNLETAVTTSDEAWPAKPVLYRMHPANIPCLTAARLDCCTLANNHVLDWGRAGLAETLSTLHGSGIRTAGAGADAAEAAAPAIIGLGDQVRILVFAFGIASSGVPRAWRASQSSAGVNWIEDLSARSVNAIRRQVAAFVRAGDIVVGSIHWGGNWGYAVTEREREFAHALIDTARVDIVHGHSSHHVKGIEVYRGRLVMYGCGDLLNDYEGIGGYEAYHGELGLMYFANVDTGSHRLVQLSMVPTQIRHFRINRAPPDAADWLLQTLDRECRDLGTTVQHQPDGTFVLRFDRPESTP